MQLKLHRTVGLCIGLKIFKNKFFLKALYHRKLEKLCFRRKFSPLNFWLDSRWIQVEYDSRWIWLPPCMYFPDCSVCKVSTCNAGDPSLISGLGRSIGEGIGYPLQYSWASTCNAGGLGSIPGLGRSSGEGKGYPLQYSGLENSMDCTIHGVTRVGHDCVTFTLLTFEGSYHLFSAQPLRMLSDI